jgi:molecular chaperone HscB
VAAANPSTFDIFEARTRPLGAASASGIMISDNSSSLAACWSCCGAVGDGIPFCETCGAVQPPGATDHFARFDLARGFDVDEQDLQARYFALQRRLHPDRLAGRSERERAISMQQSTTINEAYEILKSPLERAEYLLSLAGVTVNAETGNVATNPDVLMEAMEVREALAEAVTAEAIAALAADVAVRAAACRAALSEAFGAGETDRAAGLATRLKYLDKFSGEVRGRLAMVKAVS